MQDELGRLLPELFGEVKDGDTLFINTMTITYATVNNSLTDVVLKIETTLDQRAGYWKISDMAVSYKGKYEVS